MTYVTDKTATSLMLPKSDYSPIQRNEEKIPSGGKVASGMRVEGCWVWGVIPAGRGLGTGNQPRSSHQRHSLASRTVLNGGDSD